MSNKLRGRSWVAGEVTLTDGGTVTQATDINTAVTVNTMSGQITTVGGPTIGVGTPQTFSVVNSRVAAVDTIVASVATQFTDGLTDAVVTAVAAGSFDVTLVNVGTANVSAGTATVNFNVIKGSAT
jgi:hypothetical protein